MNEKFLNQFLDNGFFIGNISENKIWCMTSSIKNTTSCNSDSFPFFYLNNFFTNKKKPFYKGAIFIEFTFTELINLLEKEKDMAPNINWEKTDKEFYLKQYIELKKELNLSKLKKGVPYSYQKGFFKNNKKNIVFFLKNILRKSQQKSSFIYGYWNKEEGTIGTTPELLFIQKNNSIRTIALAGTIPNNQSISKEEFLNDPKIKNEHNFVIEGMKNTLSKYGTFQIGNTHLLELPKLIHLKTDIKIDLNNSVHFEYESFLNDLHPTAALGTLPKAAKSNWLYSFDTSKINRGFFAAPFGVILDKNNSIFISTIRGIQWNKTSAKISAGGGVIKESVFELEWEEIKTKINSIKSNLGLECEL